MYKVKKQLSTVIILTMLLAVMGVSAPVVQAESASQARDEGLSPATVYSYEPSSKYEISTDYALKVNGVEVKVIKAFNDYDYANFSVSEGPVTYEVTILNTNKAHEYAISPKKLNITPAMAGRTITFTTDKDEYIILNMNNRTKRLVIAADPMETDVPTETGEGVFNVTDAPYGVATSGDQTGVADRTAAIQQAIDDASGYGTSQGSGVQGIVYIPAGTYYIGNLVLKSNTALYMAPGATFVGTGKTADYEEHWFKDSMGRPATWWISTAFDSSNIKIYGRGTIDGNGRALHDDKSTNGKGMINNLVVPIATEDFIMDGIIIRESAAWAVMPVRSNDLLFTNLKMFNSLSMGENDGIDIVESQNAVIRNTIGIALDDPYSTKAWKEDTDIASGKVPWPGDPEPVENVLFEDAIAWTLCYGYKIGQGVMQDQRNIVFRDAVVYKAAVGFAIHHKYGVGEVSGVTFENIDIEEISGRNEDNSAWMTLFTVEHGGNGVGPVNDVTVKDITVRDAGESFAKIKGQEGAEITNVTFENIYMPGSEEPATTLHEMNFLSREFYSGITIKPVHNPEPRIRTNLALHKPAVGSSSDGAEDTSRFAFDGELSTRFGSKRGIDPGWLYVDLGSDQMVDRVHLYWEAAYGKAYKIQVTTDDPSFEENWETVYETTDGKGGLEEIAFDAAEARYVRMYGTARATQYGYSIWEMEVYGPEVFVESIALDKKSLNVTIGETARLTAVLLPENATNKKVLWTSSDQSVATVDENGLVTAKGTGTASITVSTQYGELSDVSTVTVAPAANPGGGAGYVYIPPVTNPSTEKATVLINDQAESVGELEKTIVNGKQSMKVKLLSDQLVSKLNELGEGAVISVQLPANQDSKPDIVIGEIDGAILKQLQEGKAVIELVAEEAAYQLPLQYIDLNALLKEAGEQLSEEAAMSSMKLQIKMEKPTTERMALAEAAAKRNGYTFVSDPFDFSVQIVIGNTVAEITQFNAYVGIMIALSENANSNGLYTGVKVAEDGSVRHVPTSTVKLDGKTFAKLSSLTNSVYVIVSKPVHFKDMVGHWAEHSVIEMGARLIVNGSDNGSFLPEQAISRAEFAAIIGRALGLEALSGQSAFQDVTEADWYYDAVHTAHAYQLINGFGDGTFRPLQSITREEAMLIVAKALTVAGSDTKLSNEEIENLLGSFEDRGDVSGWAVEGVAKNLMNGIVQGKGKATLAPKALISRAEAAVISERLLQKQLMSIE
ncbi:hypothetical protein EBB07_08425 [Paenibacillaceae bacterium]|nr:hypothetical protein EBB07_08425 [Paenibacillaceae bacterium]